ncbi:MAG: hypothetical protein AB7H96_17645 [Vicinamibacterales bacterium]
MKRLCAVALVVSLGSVSTAFAGESLLSTGTRHVQQLAVNEPVAPAAEAGKSATPTVAKKPATAYQGGGSTLSNSGMGKGKKALLYIGLAVGFAASVWAIDHNVLDVTPSSLGTRQD